MLSNLSIRQSRGVSRFCILLGGHELPVDQDLPDNVRFHLVLFDVPRPDVVGLLLSNGGSDALGGAGLLEALGIMRDGMGHGGWPHLDGRRVERGHCVPPFVHLGQFDAMGVFDDKAEARIEGADTIDLG